MNNLKKILTIIILFFFLFLLFKYNYLLAKTTMDAVYLWLGKVFPNLFIMFILNDIIINTNLLSFLNKGSNSLFNKIFHTNGPALEAFLLSLFSGTPSSAFILKEMVQNGRLSLEDANKLIAYTYFPNPLFLYAILSLSFNKVIVIRIILVIYLTNLVIGLFFKGKKKENCTSMIREDQENHPLLSILPLAITKSINTLLMILGSITFYMIISNLILKLPFFSPLTSIIIKGLLEITQALNSLPSLTLLSFKKEIIAIIIISFGGISIHTQILQILEGTKIKYQNFFFGRLMHVLISTSSYILIKIFFIR